MAFPHTMTDADVEQMKRIERALVDLLVRYTGSTHPLLIVYALMRSIRTLLRKTSRSEQKQIVPVLTAFLEGKGAPPEKSNLILPKNYLQ